MIDSCDPAIAGWSDDGKTFVVKNVSEFESSIIPQFFKHNKFASFVRQLNFYSFRKLKYVDTIRLDPQLEASTKNYWRFHHPCFQRGQPQLLAKIKRMTAQQSRAATEKESKKTAAIANTTSSNDNGNGNVNGSETNGKEAERMKTEIDHLKAKLEEMNKNVTELTTMVQKVTLKENKKESKDQVQADTTEVEAPGAKRKKMETKVASTDTTSFPEPILSTSECMSNSNSTIQKPDIALSNNFDMDMNMDVLVPSFLDSANTNDMMDLELATPAPGQIPNSKENSIASTTSTATSSTNQDFVDQLFTAFQEEDDDSAQDDLWMMSNTDALPDPATMSNTDALLDPATLTTDTVTVTRSISKSNNNNRPDPVLMERLSEALAVLPKEMQEQIVERLIASIVSTTLMTSGNDDDSTTNKTPVANILVDDSSSNYSEEQTSMPLQTPDTHGMPLAAATLASLLSYYSQLVKEANASDDNDDADAAAQEMLVKNIPVIPCHA